MNSTDITCECESFTIANINDKVSLDIPSH
jgi:hypothetical protein